MVKLVWGEGFETVLFRGFVCISILSIDLIGDLNCQWFHGLNTQLWIVQKLYIFMLVNEIQPYKHNKDKVAVFKKKTEHFVILKLMHLLYICFVFQVVYVSGLI